MSKEKNEIIRHEWLQIFVMGLTVAGLFLWSRAESKADYRELRGEMRTYMEAIHTEMKDFHGRLCAIEERNKK
jgi:hypothetical protein